MTKSSLAIHAVDDTPAGLITVPKIRGQSYPDRVSHGDQPWRRGPVAAVTSAATLTGGAPRSKDLWNAVRSRAPPRPGLRANPSGVRGGTFRVRASGLAPSPPAAYLLVP